MDANEEKIRRRAHEIWIKEGRPKGKEVVHWEKAERELESEAENTKPEDKAGGSPAEIA